MIHVNKKIWFQLNNYKTYVKENNVKKPQQKYLKHFSCSVLHVQLGFLIHTKLDYMYKGHSQDILCSI